VIDLNTKIHFMS